MPRSGGLQVSVDADPGLPALPAAVEVAAYRIATEAVTNVTRHADARIATFRLTASHSLLQVDISDDGRGVSPGHGAGIGLTSMRERAEELGGKCTLLSRPGGSIVSARLPLAGPLPSPQSAEPLPATTALLPATITETAS